MTLSHPPIRLNPRCSAVFFAVTAALHVCPTPRASLSAYRLAGACAIINRTSNLLAASGGLSHLNHAVFLSNPATPAVLKRFAMLSNSLHSCSAAARATLLLLPFIFAGCTKPPAIAAYSVPKEPAPATDAAVATGPDRMLAALITHKDKDGQLAWFFKLAGPADKIASYKEPFETFGSSVSFPADKEGEPAWTLPSGWQEEQGGAQNRFATIKIPGESPPLEITVTVMPWRDSDEPEQLLMNLNRWRKQLSLAPIELVNIADAIRVVKAAAGRAIFVDLLGALKTDAMPPPFAAMGAEPSAKDEPAPPAPKAQKSTPEKADAPVQENPDLPFTYSLPKGWQSSKAPVFAVAGFTFKKDSQQVEVSVSPLGGRAGGVLSNVNRWRTQLKLAPIEESELNSLIKETKIDGKPAKMVQLVGPQSAQPRTAITAAIVERDDATWFFRMRGDADLAKVQQENFEKFLDSIKFKSTEKK